MWMYDDVPGISDSIRAALAFRYRLAPTFYSLYVTDYQRHGWPILKVFSSRIRDECEAD
jgi:alpha-glucosidase